MLLRRNLSCNRVRSDSGHVLYLVIFFLLGKEANAVEYTEYIYIFLQFIYSALACSSKALYICQGCGEAAVCLAPKAAVIAAKIGDIPHLNNSTTLVDPSVYGYGVQKRPLDDGGKQALVSHRRLAVEY
uniref:Uncharacterized protein n=1 Tax=Anser cygnoides TaxID=8845 RepID=A0A8B9ETB9_ANSCY